MKLLGLFSVCIAFAGIAFGADVPVPVPEVGLDAPTIAGSIGVLAGGLLIMRARRNKK